MQQAGLHLVILATFSLMLSTVNCFSTPACGHKRTAREINKISACLLSASSDESMTEKDVCALPLALENCIRFQNMNPKKRLRPKCFRMEELNKTVDQVLGNLQQEIKEHLSSKEYQRKMNPSELLDMSYMSIDLRMSIIFAKCPFVLTDSKILNKQFLFLEDLNFDNNCTENEIGAMNTDLGECTARESNKMKTGTYSKTYNPRYETGTFTVDEHRRGVCSVFGRTVGKCLRKPLPTCLSARETSFLKKLISNQYKDKEFSVGEKSSILLFNSNFQVKVNLAKCDVLEEINLFKVQTKTTINRKYRTNLSSGSSFTLGTGAWIGIIFSIAGVILGAFFKCIRKVSNHSEQNRQQLQQTQPPQTNTKDVRKKLFLQAALHGDLETTLKYIESGIDLDGCNEWGMTALHLASYFGHEQIVAELLRHGAIITLPTRQGNTALDLAIKREHSQVARILLSYGAHPSETRQDADQGGGHDSDLAETEAGQMQDIPPPEYEEAVNL